MLKCHDGAHAQREGSWRWKNEIEGGVLRVLRVMIAEYVAGVLRGQQ